MLPDELCQLSKLWGWKPALLLLLLLLCAKVLEGLLLLLEILLWLEVLEILLLRLLLLLLEILLLLEVLEPLLLLLLLHWPSSPCIWVHLYLVDADPPSLLVAWLLSSCPQPLPRLLLPAGLQLPLPLSDLFLCLCLPQSLSLRLGDGLLLRLLLLKHSGESGEVESEEGCKGVLLLSLGHRQEHLARKLLHIVAEREVSLVEGELLLPCQPLPRVWVSPGVETELPVAHLLLQGGLLPGSQLLQLGSLKVESEQQCPALGSRDPGANRLLLLLWGNGDRHMGGVKGWLLSGETLWRKSCRCHCCCCQGNLGGHLWCFLQVHLWWSLGQG